MNVLLHICCAPCSIYPAKELKAKGHRIAGYFYNPNIHPYSEYLRRMAAVESYSLEAGLNVVSDEYDIEKFFQFILLRRKPQAFKPGDECVGCGGEYRCDTGFSASEDSAKRRMETPGFSPESFITHNEDRKNRCPTCWWIRLERAAKFAKENGFEAFTTTLLGSPYQDHDAIKKIGEEIARKSGLNFYYEDFRAGFKEAQETAKTKGMYRQNYCGCVFSEKEKLEKKEKSVKDKAKKA